MHFITLLQILGFIAFCLSVGATVYGLIHLLQKCAQRRDLARVAGSTLALDRTPSDAATAKTVFLPITCPRCAGSIGIDATIDGEFTSTTCWLYGPKIATTNPINLALVEELIVRSVDEDRDLTPAEQACVYRELGYTA